MPHAGRRADPSPLRILVRGKEGFLADVRDHATGAIDGLLPGAWAAARDE
jgi:hypothetical protein